MEADLGPPGDCLERDPAQWACVLSKLDAVCREVGLVGEHLACQADDSMAAARQVAERAGLDYGDFVQEAFDYLVGEAELGSSLARKVRRRETPGSARLADAVFAAGQAAG
eukprot:4512701-Alexandrium_andersonii.AAC.1